MGLYDRELELLKRVGRYRERRVYREGVVDLASNDYLGLGELPEIGERTWERLRRFRRRGAGASLLVNGYHPAHQLLEERLCELNRIEKGVVVGSGFLGNLALFQLLRRGDLGLVDSHYHSSGLVGAKLSQGEIRFFPHNDLEGFRRELERGRREGFRRIFTFVEGVYSMGGELVRREICEEAQREGFLVIDEAHSVGVVGERLLGVSELYNLNRERLVKLGTLGKSLGSYGGYILGPAEVIKYLLNRARSIIYTTALSPFDTFYGLESLEYIQRNLEWLKREIDRRRRLFQTQSLIKVVEVPSIEKLLQLKQSLEKRKIVVGAIRPPTVPKPIFRIILRLPAPIPKISETLSLLTEGLSLQVPKFGSERKN
ncbi:MAG: pyridoxal phosphate-dependent aminotransferase family protein [Campylobacterales bacterium]